MMPDPAQFNSGAVAPVECLKIGWATIKDRYWLFLGLTLLAMLIGSAVPVIIIGPMMCGLYMCLLAKMRNDPVQFDLLFKGFDYFVPGLIAAVIQVVPALILILPAYAIFIAYTFAVIPRDPDARSAGLPAAFFVVVILFVLFTVIVSMFLHLLFLFAYPLIVDRKLSGLDAVKTSVRAAMKNFGGLLGLVMLNLGLTILGVIACYVGVIFVLPITFASYAAAYRRVFPDLGPGFTAPPPPPSWS